MPKRSENLSLYELLIPISLEAFMSLPWFIIVAVFSLLSLALALLVIIPVQRIPLWMLTIGATEFGHWFALLPLALLSALAALLASSSGVEPWEGYAFWCLIVGLVAGAALLLLGSTVLRAFVISRRLPAHLAEAFGSVVSPAALPKEPFSFWRLWRVIGEPAAPPQKLVYACHGERAMHLYFYRSAVQRDADGENAKPAPCVLVIHTGGWNGGHPHEFIDFNHHLAAQGYAVAAMEYRLAPHSIWPAQRDDIMAALNYLKENREVLGLDGEQFVLLGRSAGGHLAQAAAYTAGDPAVRGCIAFYAPADMHLAYKYARDDDILKSSVLMRNFLGGAPQDAWENYQSASSILHVRRDSPPTLLLHGKPDPMVWHIQSRRLSAALTESGVRNCYIEVPWGTHAFDFNLNGPGGQISAYAVRYFLAAVINPKLALERGELAQSSGRE